MITNKLLELQPHDNQKSYYGKAKVHINDNMYTLYSYDTRICTVANGKLYRHWGGYTATTMRHIKSFLVITRQPGGGKKWWDSLPIEEVG